MVVGIMSYVDSIFNYFGNYHTIVNRLSSIQTSRMNTLIIVDYQNDFVQENAPLSVNGAIKAVEKINELLETGKINHVIFTVDWHPANHCSFKENGGKWPTHCVAYTEGASIYSTLYTKCIELHIPYQVLEKGSRPELEEYGAISEIKDKRTHYELHSNNSMVFLNKRNDIIVCGVAGDYCVLTTLQQLKPLYPKVFLEGIASIDGGKALDRYISENNVSIFK